MEHSHLEKLTVTQLVKKFPAFYEPKVHYRVQQPATGHYPEPDESSPHIPRLTNLFPYLFHILFTYRTGRSRDSSVSIVTRLRDGQSGFHSGRGSELFSSLRPGRFWVPPSLLSNGYRGPFA